MRSIAIWKWQCVWRELIQHWQNNLGSLTPSNRLSYNQTHTFVGSVQIMVYDSNPHLPKLRNVWPRVNNSGLLLTLGKTIIKFKVVQQFYMYSCNKVIEVNALCCLTIHIHSYSTKLTNALVWGTPQGNQCRHPQSHQFPDCPYLPRTNNQKISQGMVRLKLSSLILVYDHPTSSHCSQHRL